MTSSCANGHVSEATDFCDQCGIRIGPPRPTPSVPAEPAATAQPVSDGEIICPACQASNLSGARFCEDCAADLKTGLESQKTHEVEPAPHSTPQAAPGEPPVWVAIARPDRAYFDRMQSEGVEFPVVGIDRRFQLAGERMVVGRRSVTRGLNPEIDLSSPPIDVGVSHQHAVLMRQPDGSWAIVDPGSTNGVFLNDAVDALPVNRVVGLADGDRVHLGAWTTLSFAAQARPTRPTTSSTGATTPAKKGPNSA